MPNYMPHSDMKPRNQYDRAELNQSFELNQSRRSYRSRISDDITNTIRALPKFEQDAIRSAPPAPQHTATSHVERSKRQLGQVKPSSKQIHRLVENMVTGLFQRVNEEVDLTVHTRDSTE